jgi:hypothetical protein
MSLSALFFEGYTNKKVKVNSEGGKHVDFLIFRQTQYEFTIYDLGFTIPHMNTETLYNQALDYLYSFVDYSLKHSSELAKADFNLNRMFALMESLGDTQKKYPIIHVAGTKGKGSTSALCAAGLQAAG